MHYRFLQPVQLFTLNLILIRTVGCIHEEIYECAICQGVECDAGDACNWWECDPNQNGDCVPRTHQYVVCHLKLTVVVVMMEIPAHRTAVL